MQLDGLTLMAAGSFVAAMCGFLVLGAWAQIRVPALLWWAGATLFYAASVGILAFSMAAGNMPAIAAGGIVGALAPPMMWAGVRQFNGQKQLLLWLAAGPLAVIVAGILPGPSDAGMLPRVVSFMVWVAYLAAAAVEFWRHRSERLPARAPLIGLLGLHAFVFVGGIVDSLKGNMTTGVVPPLSSWFSLIHFEGLVYAIGTSTLLVLLCKERIEQRQITASRHDSLTGVTNRGAFLNSAERALRRCQADAISFSLIMFDLDRFKWINDTFGHDVGDAVLRLFAETTGSVLRPNDLFGRYGGEEFVVVLPGATIEAAYVIAERVRHRFQEAGAYSGSLQTNATVSGGVASATSVSTLETIMRAADQAMYRAKSLGRNRVERVARDAQALDDETAAVVRIA